MKKLLLTTILTILIFLPNIVFGAVAWDSLSESDSGTTGNTSSSSFSWTHTPVGTLAGIVCFSFTNFSVDIVSAMDYGGVAMTAVSGGYAVDTATEPGDTKAWFLGSSIPTGAQTITVTRTNNATSVYAACHAVTASTDTEIYLPGIVLLQNNGTFAEQNVDDGSPGTDSLRIAGTHSGNSSQFIPGASSTWDTGATIDYGVRVDVTVRETTPGQGSRPVGFSYGTSDDRAAVHLAIREIPSGSSSDIKTINDLAIASVKTLFGLAIASVKSFINITN